MFGRIFGRGKDETDQAVCAQCGRTLLVGEWTQNVVGADGENYLICSLCGQSHVFPDAEPVATGTTPANNGRVRESLSEVPPSAAAPVLEWPDEPELDSGPAAVGPDARDDSDAVRRALRDKDAEIEGVRVRLARLEDERQQLAARLAAAQGAGEAAAQVPREPLVPAAAAAAVGLAEMQPPREEAGAAVSEPARPAGDSSAPGERTWGETPAEFASELAALRDEGTALAAQTPPEQPASGGAPAVVAAGAALAAAADDDAAAEGEPSAPARPAAAAAPEGVPAVVFEDTQPIPEVSDDMTDEGARASFVADDEAPHESETTLTPEPAAVGPEPSDSEPEPSDAEPDAAELEAEAAALTLLQRGVDLLNVSPVPRKIAETSEQLGLPLVHVASDGHTTAVTFMWSMGWYRYRVDADSGSVRMDDRGYDELTDLRPNAAVRADGTVQLAPAQISRAAAQRLPAEQQAAPAPAAPATPPAEPESPSVVAQKAPEILSKSLLGQRSDDDAASWEKTQAREFDWNH